MYKMRALALGGVLLASALTGAVGVGTANAVPGTVRGSCDGAGCTGLDPIAAGCAADAFTPAGAVFSGPRGTVELRYSPSCHANWARITNSSAGTWFYVQNSNNEDRREYVPSGNNSAYTNMVNGYVRARAGDLDNHTNWY